MSWACGAPCLPGRGAPGSMMCGSFLLQQVLLLGWLPFTAELGEAWWNSERSGDSGGRAGVYGIAVPTEAGGLARPAGFGYYQDCRCRFFLLVKIV